MKYPFIKLYSRTVVSWRSTTEKAPDTLTNFMKEHIKHEIQLPKADFKYTNRKKNPVDVEISFYDLQTIKQIIEDNEEYEI